MAMQKEENKPRRVTFQVIDGGRSETDRAETPRSRPYIGAATAHALEEEERLRQAIFQAQLNEAKVTVRQALRELTTLDESSEDEAIQVRRAVLHTGLTDLGISFIRKHARPDREGARWALTHPNRLLAAKPDFAPLYPLAHHMFVLAREEYAPSGQLVGI